MEELMDCCKAVQIQIQIQIQNAFIYSRSIYAVKHKLNVVPPHLNNDMTWTKTISKSKIHHST